MAFFFFPFNNAVPEDEVESNKPVPNEDIVSQLVSMGFNQLHCEKAAIRTSNAGVEEAMNWLLSHMDDAGISDLVLACGEVFLHLGKQSVLA